MATEKVLVPHLALKDLNIMHNCLQHKLKLAKDIYDLIGFINHLMPLNSLKVQLSSLLHQQFIKKKNIKNRKY